MEDNLVNFGQGQTEADLTPTNNNPGNNAGDVSFGKGLIYFFEGAGIVLFVFIVSYLIVKYFGIHYIFVSFISLLFTVLAIKAFDKATGEKPTPLSGPVQSFIVIVFVISLLYGYNINKTNGGNNDNATEQINKKCETLTMLSPENHPMTSKCYHAGEQVQVIVYGNPVKIVCGEVLSVGSHVIPITSDGRLCFHTLTKASAKVEVY